MKNRSMKNRQIKNRSMKSRQMKNRSMKNRQIKDRSMKHRQTKNCQMKNRSIKNCQLKNRSIRKTLLSRNAQKFRRASVMIFLFAALFILCYFPLFAVQTFNLAIFLKFYHYQMPKTMIFSLCMLMF